MNQVRMDPDDTEDTQYPDDTEDTQYPEDTEDTQYPDDTEDTPDDPPEDTHLAISIEPVVFLYLCSTQLSDLIGQNLLLLKECVEDTPAPGCSDCPDEAAAQKAVTNIQTWRDLIAVTGPVMFVMFAGTWSDSHGRRRKPLMYLPLGGQLISDLLCILNVYFWKWSPNFAALAQAIPTAVTGGRPCFQLGEVTYISDTSTENSRTFRIGVVFSMHFLAKLVANLLFGVTFNNSGLYGVYWISVILNVSSVIYLCLFISEKNVIDIPEKKSKSIVNFGQVMQSIKTVFKPREGYRRAVILMAVVLAPTTDALGTGLSAVGYLFFRYKFHWCPAEFGYFGAYLTFVIFIGTLITIGVFNRILKISDSMIGVLSQATQVMAYIGFAFVSTTWGIMLWSLLTFMHAAGLTVVYSILSKNIAPSEAAQANSVVGLSEAIYPLINLPLNNQLYRHTFEVLPGAVFLLGAFYSAVALVLFVVIHILQKKTDQQGSLT